MSEVRDVPGSVDSRYRLEFGDPFSGLIERNGTDYIGVQLEAGRSYEFLVSTEMNVRLHLVLRDAEGVAVTPEVASNFWAQRGTGRLTFTAPETGLFFIEPQLPPRSVLPREGRSYTITAADYGVLGLEETLEAPVGPGYAMYSIGEGETFSGTLTDQTQDADGLWLDFEQSGQYRVIISHVGGVEDGWLMADIWDPRLREAAGYDDTVQTIVENGQVDFTLDIFGPTRRYVDLTNLTNSSLNSLLGVEYEVRFEYIGALDNDVSLEVPFVEGRPVDETPFYETRDLRVNRRDAVLEAGDTLYGTFTEDDEDTVTVQIQEGVNYGFWFTGTGVNPIDQGWPRSNHPDFRFYSQGLDFYSFTATFTGELRITLRGSATYMPGDAAHYSFTFDTNPYLDEVEDAPADRTTRYFIGEDGHFTGTAFEGDQDWIRVRLEEGHTYSFASMRLRDLFNPVPVLRNGNGSALTYEVGDSYYTPYGETLFTASRTGVFFLDPQMTQSTREQYHLVVEDLGVLGLTETYDSDTWVGRTPWVVSDGETFSGSLADFEDGSLDHGDIVRLNASAHGLYRVTTTFSNGTVFSEVFYATEDQERDHYVNNFRNTEYTVHLDRFGELIIDEVVDLPRGAHDVLPAVQAGEVFLGYLDVEDADHGGTQTDYVPLATREGEIYFLTYDGYGADIPLSFATFGASAQLYGSDNEEYLERFWLGQSIVLEPTATGTVYLGIYNEFSSVQIGFYEITYELYEGVFQGDGLANEFPGSSLDDTIRGFGGDDSLAGASGQDFLDGGDGHDVLYGGGGRDTLIGGAGNDALSGDEGKDTMLGGAGRDEMAGGDGNDTLRGGGGRDTLNGGEGSDRLFGNGQSDTIGGGYGDDLLNGGAGNDALYGGYGDDRLFGGSGNDTLQDGSGENLLSGGSGNDLLLGGWQDDTLHGDRGNDTLSGGDGWDLLIGGSGADVFLFDTPSYGLAIDVIADFDLGQDQMQFDRSVLRPNRIDNVLASAETIGPGTVRHFEDYQLVVTFDQAGVLVNISNGQYVFLTGYETTQGLEDAIFIG